jgi:hypothetical protein
MSDHNHLFQRDYMALIQMRRKTKEVHLRAFFFFLSTKDCAEMASMQSSTVWTEGLVPGINFCNHDAKGKA